MMRLYHFDLIRNTIDVETISPWILAQDAGGPQRAGGPGCPAHRAGRLLLDSDRLRRAVRRVRPRSGPAAPGPRKEMLMPGTLAYWRFDAGRADGSPVTAGQTIRDLSGTRQRPEYGGDRAGHRGRRADLVRPTTTPTSPATAACCFDGGQNPLHGAYLTTGAKAPLNTETFTNGLHHRAVREDPARLGRGATTRGMSALSRWGEAGQAGKQRREHRPERAARHPQPLDNGREPQWNCYPLNETVPVDQLGPGAGRGRVVAPGRRQRRPAHGAVRRGRAESSTTRTGGVDRPHLARPALAAGRLRVRRAPSTRSSTATSATSASSTAPLSIDEFMIAS